VERLLGEAEEAKAYTKVRLRIKWKVLRGKKADLYAFVGGKRDACRTNVESRGGRGGRGIGGIGETSQFFQGGATQANGIARCTYSRATGAAAVREREVGEEAEGTGRGNVGSMIEEDWDVETVFG
jgi:hypothetical protein